jgi:hypothetical protein
VNVLPGEGGDDAKTWFIRSEIQAAAHEVGHLMNVGDEYPDEKCPRRPVRTDGSIMSDHWTGSPKARHYQHFADWVSQGEMMWGGECTVRAVGGKS